jgi:NAD(P)-dependent dehydrogenase (short-subunit alcohol dehydrogenase family)
MRNAIVTGGGSGIGRAISMRLANDGADVAILDINAAGAAETAAAIRDLGRRATAFETDVSDAKAVDEGFAQARSTLGALQILVSVAGIGEFVPFIDMTEQQWDRMIAVHLKGTYNCAKAAVGDMLESGWGRIVNIASVAGLNGGGSGLAHYSAAKGGIIGFTKALAYEVGPRGVTVNAIAPGLINTPMIRDSGVAQIIIQATKERSPMRRVGLPGDIAPPAPTSSPKTPASSPARSSAPTAATCNHPPQPSASAPASAC